MLNYIRIIAIAVLVHLAMGGFMIAAAGELYPKGTNFCFTFYSTKNPDALSTLTNGATVIGPYYGSQTAPLANAVAWNTKLIYKIRTPSLAGLGAADFDTPGFVWPSNTTVSNETAAIVNAVKTNANIAFWDTEPEELRPWKSAEMNCLRIMYAAVHANDVSNRPVYMYQPNNRTAANLGLTMTNQDLCAKGTYVSTITDDLGNSCMTNRIWARWSMDQIVQACNLYNTNSQPWIVLWMAADPPAGFTTTTITNWCRHDAYMGLIMGGKGIEIWSGSRGRVGFSDPYFDAYLGGYLTVAKDLNGALNLAPVFLFGQSQSNITMSITGGPATQHLEYGGEINNYPSITYRRILYNGSSYLFMVNSAQQSVTATFSGLSTTSWLDLFAGTNVLTPGGASTITLPPLAVRAFQSAPSSNAPPSFVTNVLSLPAAIIGTGCSNSIAASATDPDLGDILTFSKLSGPSWLNIATNGAITGTPVFANYGDNTFTVQVTDSFGASATAAMLINVLAPNCGPLLLWSENFTAKTLATLTNQGWTFSGQAGAELVGSTANSASLGTISYLRIGSNTVSQPFGQKSFGPVTNGQFKAITFTTSSFSNARLKLLNESGSTLFAFYLNSTTALAVENISPTFSTNPMPNSASHNLLSSGTQGYTELTVTWGGSNMTWQAVNRNATNGVVVYDTGIQSGIFTNAGVPNQLRLDTGTYNNSARYFGTTAIRVADTTGTCFNQPPVFTNNPILKSNASVNVFYTNSIASDATDPDSGDLLTFSKVGGPAWLTVATHGTLSGTPVPGNTGTNTFTVRVTDLAGATNDATLRIVVLNPAPPVITSGLSVSDGNFNFQFSGTPGQHYRVEFSPVLPAPGPWQVVTDIVSLATSPFAVSHPLMTNQGFYRVAFVP